MSRRESAKGVAAARATEVTKLCGAKRKGKKPCGLVAGWGTDHVGSGRCRKHGGSTPTQKLGAARERAMDLAVEVMGTMQALDPTESLLLAVWRSASISAGYARAMSAMPAGEARDALVRDLRAANREQAQIAHMAISGRVSERQVEQMNRWATAFARVAENAFVATLGQLEFEDVRGAQAVFAVQLGRELARLEDGIGDDIEGTAAPA